MSSTLFRPSPGCSAKALPSSRRRSPDRVSSNPRLTTKENAMSNTQTSKTQSTRTAPVDMKLEVVVVPVTDVDRAKRFYESLGWRVDADFSNGDDWHLVQMTPPGSPCSVMFGKGFTTAVPGSVQGTFLVVDDLEAARAQLTERGVDV